MGNRKALQPAKKRPVYVNGVWCESLTEGMVRARKILKRTVRLWEIQRAANGQIAIPGLTVSEAPPDGGQEKTCADCLNCKVSAASANLAWCAASKNKAVYELAHWTARKPCKQFDDMGEEE